MLSFSELSLSPSLCVWQQCSIVDWNSSKLPNMGFLSVKCAAESCLVQKTWKVTKTFISVERKCTNARCVDGAFRLKKHWKDTLRRPRNAGECSHPPNRKMSLPTWTVLFKHQREKTQLFSALSKSKRPDSTISHLLQVQQHLFLQSFEGTNCSAIYVVENSMELKTLKVTRCYTPVAGNSTLAKCAAVATGITTMESVTR